MLYRSCVIVRTDGGGVMRWIGPDIGDKRIVKRFAILPIIVYNETVWLEFVKIEQVYGGMHHGWTNSRFVE